MAGRSVTGSSLTRRAALLSWVLGAALIVVAVVAMPWARYRLAGGTSHSLAAGGLGAALVAIAALVLALSAFEAMHPRRATAVMVVGAGACACVLTVLTAAGRMADANGLVGASAGTTSWALGSMLAAIAAGAITAGGLLGFVAG